jgi:predicted AAA+ superfamily ATPase
LARIEKRKKILIIDEIQKIQNWSEVIKKLWDEDKRKSSFQGCVLLGSSSLDIQRGLTESLTGRFILHPAFHWNYEESDRAYKINFEQYLKYGGYPGSYQLIGEDERSWKSYVKNSIILTVIEKDILQFNTVKKPALFKQAFEVIMSYPAQEISFTKLLGQLQDGGNVELIKYYLSLYEGAYLIKVLDKFSNKKTLVKSSSPKILPMSPCLYYLEIQSEYTEIERGRVFEVIVGMQFVRTGEQIFYWREGNFEVDYILKKGKKVFAIEVKSGRKKSSLGLDKFCEKFPGSQKIIITIENYQKFEEDPMGFLMGIQEGA